MSKDRTKGEHRIFPKKEEIPNPGLLLFQIAEHTRSKRTTKMFDTFSGNCNFTRSVRIIFTLVSRKK